VRGAAASERPSSSTSRAQISADFAACKSKSRASRRAITARRNSALSIPALSPKPTKKGQVYFGRLYLGKRDKDGKTTTKVLSPLWWF